MSDLAPELSEAGFDREAIEVARRSAFAVATHRPEDFEGMRLAGRMAAEVLDLLVPEVRPGVSTAALDKLAFEYTLDHGGVPACVGYRGYRHTLCTSVNHVVCHGIPSDRPVPRLDRRFGHVPDIDQVHAGVHGSQEGPPGQR